MTRWMSRCPRPAGRGRRAARAAAGTGAAWAASAGSAAAAARVAGRRPAGMVRVKALPSPGRLWTVIVPPSSSASRRLIARPSPAPPSRRVASVRR